MQRSFSNLAKQVSKLIWKKLSEKKLAKSQAPNIFDTLKSEYHVEIQDKTDGTVPIGRVLASVIDCLQRLCDSGAIVRDALQGYSLNTIVLYNGQHIPCGWHANAMADYEADECRLYIAAERALEPSQPLTLGAHNVCKDFDSVFNHEMGHLIMDAVQQEARVNMRQIYDDYGASYWSGNVSEYAATDDRELFAECFAAYMHPDYEEGMLPTVIENVFEAAGIDAGVDKLSKAVRKPANVILDDGTVIEADTIDDILDAVEDADWFIVENAMSDSLMDAFNDAGFSELVTAGVSTNIKMVDSVKSDAENYASEHGAELVSGLDDSTQDMLRGTVEDAVREGWDADELSTEIDNSYAFGEARADLIARNELALAYSKGRVSAAGEAGATGKRWLLSADHDDNEDCDCSDAADAGVVDFDESFTDNDDYDFPPGHVNCACDWVGVYGEDDDSDDDDADDGLDEDEEHGKFVKGYDPDQPRNSKGEWSAYGDVKHDDLRAKMAKHEELSAAQQTAVRDYQGKGYRSINSALRKDAVNESQKTTINHLANAVRASVLPKNATLYRGVSSLYKVYGTTDPNKLVGKTIKDKGFLSTSASRDRAVSGEVRIHLNVPKGTYALAVHTGHDYDSEKEILLQRGSSYTINSVKTKRYSDGYKVHHLYATYNKKVGFGKLQKAIDDTYPHDSTFDGISPQEYSQNILSDKDTSDNQICMELSNKALVLAGEDDRIGQRISGKADGATRMAIMNYQTPISRAADHQIAYEWHTQAAAHYEEDTDNVDAAAAHNAAAAAHKKVLDRLRAQISLGKYDPDQPRDADGRWGAMSEAGEKIANEKLNSQMDNSDIQRYMEAHGVSKEGFEQVRNALYAHNVASGAQSDERLTNMWNSNGDDGKALRAFSALQEHYVLNKMPKGEKTLFYRKGELDKAAISTTLNRSGAKSGSSNFEPDRKYTYSQMKANGYNLISGLRGTVGNTSAQEGEAIWLKPSIGKSFIKSETHKTSTSSHLVKYDPDQPRDADGKWGDGTESKDKNSTSSKEHFDSVKSVGDRVAKDLGYPADKISYSEEVKQFELNGTKYDYAGAAYLNTGQITMYPNVIRDPKSAAGVMAHEIGHQQYETVMNRYSAESQLLIKAPNVTDEHGISRSPLRPDGGLREGFGLEEKYPVYARMQPILETTGKLVENDGCSDYSKSWWKAYNAGTANLKQAMHETFAELSRLKYENGHLNKQGISTKWIDAYNKMSASYKIIRKKGG